MRYLAVLVITFLAYHTYSQKTIQYSISNKWYSNENISKPLFKEVYYFDETPNIPYHLKILDLPANTTIEKIEVSNKNIKTWSTYNGIIDENLSNEIITKHRIQTTKKQRQAQIWVACAKNQNGNYTTLNNADITVHLKHDKKSVSKQRNYPTHSVLKDGQWKKISLTKSGVYKITFNQITSWGLETPQNIRIYGFGGKQLSFRVSSDDPYELPEVPIWMNLGNDGIFNSGDYILFYGQGIENRYLLSDNKVLLKEHDYTTKGHYFLTTSKGPSSQINTINNNSQIATKTVNTFTDTKLVNYRINNLNETGRIFFGEPLQPGDKQEVNFTFPNIVASTDINIKSQVGAISYGVNSYINCYLENQFIKQVSILKSDSYNKGKEASFTASGRTSSENFNLVFEYSSTNVTAQGFLGYAQVSATCTMTYNNDQRIMQDLSNIDNPEIIEYRISNLPQDALIWNISNPGQPINISKESVGQDTYAFKKTGDSQNLFIAFDESNAMIPTFEGSIENQDLHGIGNYDFIILTHPDFRNQSEDLAEYHRNYDNLKVLVLEPNLIYNEFSSGNQDVSAIRNFLKSLYDKASNLEEMPKNLLLFGDGSYDNISTTNNTNYLPTFETDRVAGILSAAVDDFYVMLDEGEGGDEFSTSLNGTLDMGVGRFPVNTTQQANIILQKTLDYMKNPNLGPWKNNLVFVGDDADNSDYYLQEDAYELAEIVMTNYKWMNPKIILLDAYPQESTPAGERYPDVTKAINGHIHSGALVFNYTGHGSEERLAHEAILDKNTVKGWTNDKLPFFMTGSCEVSRFDNKNRQSLGEAILLKENGGAITLFSTTRVVWGGSNQVLSRNFYNNIFKPNEDGTYKTLGEVIQITKNLTSGSNMRNFTLFGNPALRLDVPPLRIITDSINGKNVGIEQDEQIVDTLKALKKITIHGHIVDSSNVKLNFNGTIYPIVYDKMKNKTTLDNDNSYAGTFTYKDFSNIVYKGKASIENGKFSFSFIVPFDINYEFGKGKISYYAENGNTDAYGNFERFIVGGSDTLSTSDNTGPELSLFMNDTTFISGGTVNESPLLIAQLFDEYGINTTGNTIGHDLTATLNGDVLNKIVLNDFYENDLNSYQSGQIEYQLINLEEGVHTLELKAWDILNNSSNEIIEFIVANSEDVVLEHVLNYPNPFTTKTKFIFEHNQPHEILDVRIQVFTVSGKLIKTMETSVSGTQYMNNPIVWDGRDDFGDPIGRGVYIYKVRIATPDGKTGEKFEKLVILR
jgi:hypothetical protein